MKKSSSNRFLWLAVFVILTLGCSIVFGNEPTPAPIFIPPTPMPQPIVNPTETPVPLIPTIPTTPTPILTQGPLVIDDDFSADTGRFKCDNCVVQGGVLTVGPFPMVDSWKPFITLCSDCGAHANYKMSVETWYASGKQGALGFGLVFRQEKKLLYLVAVNTVTEYTVFAFDQTIPGGVGYRHLIGNWSRGVLEPGRAVQYIDIIMKNGAMTLTLNTNLTRVINIPAGSGEVGLWVGNWESSASFDNFHYEELP